MIPVSEHTSHTAPARRSPLFVQAQLSVNRPGDSYEQEADRVADTVMRMPAGPAPFFSSHTITPVIQRKCAACSGEEEVQRKESGDGGGVNPSFGNYISSPNGGSSLSAQDQSFFSSRMSQDFSGVRIHTGSAASASASQIQAKAYTYRNNIVFNEGQYQPGTESGRRLLAHELTHVVQQGHGGGRIQRTLGDGHDLSSPRFTREPTLENVFDGTAVLNSGTSGMAVTTIQHALFDLGFRLDRLGITGTYNRETMRAVRRFQRRRRISADPPGVVGAATMAALDREFPLAAPRVMTIIQNPAGINCILELLCIWNRALIEDLHSGGVHVIFGDDLYWADIQYDGANWVPNPMQGGGETIGRTIRLPLDTNCNGAAISLYHEYHHARAPRRLNIGTWRDREIEAYTRDAQWTSDLGLWGDSTTMLEDPVTHRLSPNPASINEIVGGYPGLGGAGEEVIARVGAHHVRVQRANGRPYVRRARAGDSVPGRRHFINPRPVPRSQWRCP